MADNKLTALTAETTVATTDIVYFVDDPGGTPLSRKCTVANLSKGVDLTNVPQASGAVTVQPAAGSNVNFTLSGAGDFKINSTQFVVDSSTGNVGIGYSSPSARLAADAGTDPVAAGSFVRDQAGLNITTGTVNLELINDNATANNWATLAFGDEVSGPSGALIGAKFTDHTNNYANLAFWTRGSGGADIRMTIEDEGNIGVGGTPNANAILDVQSTTKAFMPPRMTTTQRDAISSPTEGMYIHNTTTKVLNFYNGTTWGAV